MNESLCAAIGIRLVFVLVFASLVGGPDRTGAGAGLEAVAIATTEVRGKIKSVDPVARTVLLEDGTRLVIPGSVTVNPAALKAGATVKASIEEKGGQRQ